MAEYTAENVRDYAENRNEFRKEVGHNLQDLGYMIEYKHLEDDTLQVGQHHRDIYGEETQEPFYGVRVL